MLHGILIAKLIKFVGVMLLGAGCVGGTLASRYEDRRRAAHLIASPGFMLTWAGGFMLIKQLGHPLWSAWVVGAALCSIVAMNALHWSAAREERSRRVTGPLIAAALLGALCLMIWRPG